MEKGLAVSPSSIQLKAAKHTLRLKAEGKRVPPRLEKFAGDDNGYLKQFVCPLPFERFDIGPNGLVMVCCWSLATDSYRQLYEPADARCA